MRVLLTGGGTGGHIYPALAIAEALVRDSKAQPLSLRYVGSADRLEARIVPHAGLPIAYIASSPLTRAFSPEILRTIGANVLGLAQALSILWKFAPDCVIATGGYVSLPVVLAARLLRVLRLRRIAIALVEPNARPGLTNRLMGPLVDESWVSLVPAAETVAKRSVFTGTPLRDSFDRDMTPEAGRLALDLDPEKITIVVIGGSQGARSLNDTVAALAALRPLPDSWQVLLVCGERDHAALAARIAQGQAAASVRVVAYLDDPRAAFAAADIVVARAGALTLAELAATKTPAILVPYPHASEDHQSYNADVFRLRGAARVLADRELNAERLWEELVRTLEPVTLARMRASAGSLAQPYVREHIIDRIHALVKVRQ